MPLDHGSLRSLPLAELVHRARSYNVENASSLRKQDLVAAILREAGSAASDGAGVLEILADGFGFLRAPEYNFVPAADDVYVSPSQIRRFNLRTGDLVGGQVRAPRDAERYFALIKVERVNGADPDVAREKVLFENLTPTWPQRALPLHDPKHHPELALLGLLAPMGYGQRAVITGPPRSGRTSLLRQLASALHRRSPETALLVVLIGERPEEVTEIGREVAGVVLATTFDEPDTRHVQVAEMALERAKRLVEHGQDVVLMLDSLDRLARAAAGIAAQPGGPIVPLDPASLLRIRRLLGAAREVEEGGSLTLIATLEASADTPAALSEAVRAAVNCSIHLDRAAADRGVWPALDVTQTRTLREDLLLSPGSLGTARAARAAGSPEAALALLDKRPALGK